jgi:tRNA A37 threonylcarbamoyladenosine synthetase subunit TsaC/SUA5/YrdC
MGMLLKIYPENPSLHSIRRVVEVLEEGGIIIYPTDTVYGMGCDIMNSRAVEKVARLKGINPARATSRSVYLHPSRQ